MRNDVTVDSAPARPSAREYMTPNPTLMDAIFDSWDRNNTILVNLLRALPDGGMDARALPSSSTVGEMLTHIHYCRLLFIHQDAPEFAPHPPNRACLAERDPDRIAQMLHESAQVLRDAVRNRIETGKPMLVRYDHPLLMLQHMLWHDAYHHGQIKLALMAAGHPFDDEEIGPVTWDIWMLKSSAPQTDGETQKTL